MSDVVEIERCGVRAVPPVESVIIEGWHIGLGRGQVHRMNSVTTFGIVPGDALETIETVERRYGARHRPAEFRMTELDAEVDDLLYARGYERSTDVLVMTMPVDGEPDDEVTMAPAATPGWIDDLGRLGGYDELRSAEIGESLAGLTLTHGAFRIGRTAVGLAVVDGPWVGLFDIAVDPESRRDGLGSRISRAMLAWAAGEGAERAYLQVTAANEAALALYGKIGFRTVYPYWYRTKG